MESRNIKKLLIIAIIILLVVGCALWVLSRRRGKISFEMNDQAFAESFTNLNEFPEQYDFISLDAYYDSNTGMYYYNAKYNLYIEIEKEWDEIDAVFYGNEGRIINFFCLNWADLSAFKDEKNGYENALKDGTHNTYTKEEIQQLLKK